MRRVTGTAFTFAYRFMQVGTPLQVSEKVFVAGGTEFTARSGKQSRVLGGVGLVAVITLPLDHGLMPNPAGKCLAFMAFEAVI